MIDGMFPPAPPNAADRIDHDKVTQGLVDHLPPDVVDTLPDGRLWWAITDFDRFGLGRLTTWSTEGALLGVFEVHWSAVVRAEIGQH